MSSKLVSNEIKNADMELISKINAEAYDLDDELIALSSALLDLRDLLPQPSKELGSLLSEIFKSLGYIERKSLSLNEILSDIETPIQLH